LGNYVTVYKGFNRYRELLLDFPYGR